MEGAIIVGNSVPDFPRDGFGNIIREFPLIEYTPGRLIEIDLSWEPHVIKTGEKTIFIYQFYDPMTNSNLQKIVYDFIIIQNDNEIFRSNGLLQIGGDYRNFIFENSGPITIRFENLDNPNLFIETSAGISGAKIAAAGEQFAEFSTIVYENPEEVTTKDVVIQPARRLEFQYELAVAIILIPGAIFVSILIWSTWKKPTSKKSHI